MVDEPYRCNAEIQIKDYHIFPLAKQVHSSFPLSSSRTKSTFDLIHMDVWGPYRIPTYDGFQYFLTIVDNHS